MNDRDLHYIVTIEQEGSIQKAAGTLSKSASSLTRCVQRVEKELDVQLFRRTPEGLLPTPEGTLYVETARKILSLYEQLKLSED